MFIVAHKDSLSPCGYEASRTIYPTLEFAEMARKVNSFNSRLEFKIFSLSPVEEFSPTSPNAEEGAA